MTHDQVKRGNTWTCEVANQWTVAWGTWSGFAVGDAYARALAAEWDTP
jgi:hypothetical protein